MTALLDQQTGNQAQLARTQGNQEAACKRLSRLLHNERLAPKRLADAVCQQALRQLPKQGLVRCTIAWTSEGDQPLCVVSLVLGQRAVPIYWRAYQQSVLKGRMKRYEWAVVKRAFHLITQVVAPARLRVTADRGFADGDLFCPARPTAFALYHPRQGEHQSLLGRYLAEAPPGEVRRA